MNTEELLKQLFEIKDKFCTYARKEDANSPCYRCRICVRGSGGDWMCPFWEVKDAITNERYKYILMEDTQE